MSAIGERRFGYFKISLELVPEEFLFRFWSLVVPVRSEYLFADQVCAYVGASYLFRPIGSNEKTPEYIVSMTQNGIKVEERV